MNAPEAEPARPAKTWGVFLIVALLAYAIPATFVAIRALTDLGAQPLWQNLSLVVAGTALFCIALWGLWKDRIPFGAIGLTLPKLVEALLLALVGWAIVVLVLYVFLLLPNDSKAGELFGKSLLYVLKYWVFVAVAEELLFRGYMLTRLMDAWTARHRMLGGIGALAAANLLFATAHIPQRLYQVAEGEKTLGGVAGSVVLLFIAGLVFSYFFLRTKNVLLAGLIHGAVIVPLVGVGEDAFLPVVIVAALYIEAYLFLRRKILQKRPHSANSLAGFE